MLHLPLSNGSSAGPEAVCKASCSRSAPMAIRLPRRPAKECMDGAIVLVFFLPGTPSTWADRVAACVTSRRTMFLMNIVIVLILQLHASASVSKYRCTARVACLLSLYAAGLAKLRSRPCDGNRSPCHHFPFPITVGTLDRFETETK